jgi:sigma-B regulation protein RsbU (phosphoserine phosphatase)
MARQVQLRLLPSTPPQPRRAEIAAAFLPARSIGGDMYDFLDYGAAGNALYTTSQPDRIAIVLGDVSGKAAPAALYAALVSGILRSLAARHLAPADLLAELNDQLQERKLDSQYVTMLMAIWNDDDLTLRIANAGSVQPLYVTQSVTETIGATPSEKGASRKPDPDCLTPASLTTTTIPAEGFPLGLFPKAEYDELTIPAHPGDLFLFFSDGITDALNAEGESFGPERLEAVLRDHPSACHSAQSTVDAILAAVAAFQSGTAHFDDETLVVLRVL